MRIYRWWVAILIVVLFTTEGFAQQLRLGGNSAANIKSAVLELQSTNQGLLFTRIADTALINTLNPPDGMVVYFTPAKRLLLRANGAWQSLASTTSIDTTNIPNFYLKVRNELSGGTGINYNNVTGVISNAGVTTLNGNTGALTMDTGYISNFYGKVRGLFGATAPITLTNGQIGITQATTSTNGYLSSTDWNMFNSKLNSIDTTNIANFYLKVRSEHAAGTGISYNATTGVISNAGVISLNGSTGALTMDTTYISNFYLKVRSEHAAGTGITYNATTGVISNAGVTSLNGNTGTLTMDTTFISNFYQKVRGLFSAGTGISYNNTTGVITAANNWAFNGNTVGALKTLGTVDNYDLPIITNNVERMRITNTGHVGIGVTNATNPLVVKDTLEIRRVGTLSTLLFSNTSGTGDFRIGGDGGDIFWQGGGGRNLQMGSYWTTILMGDRQSGTFPTLSTGSNINTGILIPASRDASVPLAIQANSATQSANLTEWRNSTGTVMDIVDETGSVAIGTSTFDGTSPEKLLVDAGTTLSYNVISGKGSINNYLQLNIQNKSSGTGASSDVVATADNGSETANFIDMGINSSLYATSGMLGGANNAYLYSTGNDFVIGNGTSAKNLRFFTGGTATTNERVRIDGNGKVGINTTAPAATLDVAGTYKLGSSGTALNNMIKTSFSITDNGAFGLGTTKVVTATISGATTGSTVILNPRSNLPTAVAIAYSYISSANTITIGFTCSQGVLSSSTLGTITFDVTMIQ